MWKGQAHEEGLKTILLILSDGNHFKGTISLYINLMASYAGGMFRVLKKKTCFTKQVMHVSMSIHDIIEGETGVELNSDVHWSASSAGPNGRLGLPEFPAAFIW